MSKKAQVKPGKKRNFVAVLGSDGKFSSSLVKVDFWGQALEAKKNGSLDTAIKTYNAALNENPNDASLWVGLAMMLRASEKLDATLVCLEKAVFLQPNNASIQTTLANHLAEMGLYDKSIKTYEALLSANPNSADIRNRLGVIYVILEHFDKAIACFMQAISIEPEYPHSHWNLAHIQLSQGDFKNGLKSYQYRWAVKEEEEYSLDIPVWTGEPLENKTVLLLTEQGNGDVILALRFAQWVKQRGAKRVVFGCGRILERLVQNVVGVDEVAVDINKHTPCDVQVRLMNLPQLLGLNLENIPPPARMTWHEKDRIKYKKIIEKQCFANDLRVGIIWSGNVNFVHNKKRAVALDRFLHFASLPNIRLFSLQKGTPAQELEEIGSPLLVYDLAQHIDDFADTAAAMQELDLIIMTDSGAAHLAGSLDIPVWNLLHSNPYWLYMLDREDTPWYPSMRLFRQPKPGDWDTVFSSVADCLTVAAQKKADGETDLRHVLLPHLLQS